MLLCALAAPTAAQTVSVPATQTVAEPAAHGTVTVTFTGDPNNSDTDWSGPSISSGGTADGRQSGTAISCQAGDDFVLHTDSFAIISGQSSHTSGNRITICADTVDEPDEKFIISWTLLTYGLFDSNASHCPFTHQCLTTFTITDDDPTVVSIARVGSGAVTEGGKIEFTVTLGRALVADEIIDVPLSIGGTNVTTGDWSLALKPGATNTGVARRIGNVFRFAGAGAQTATLELTAVDDGAADHNETFNIALGAHADFDDSSLGTNVGGGADPHSTDNTFSVTVNEPPPSVSVHPADSIGREGGTGWPSVELRLRRALSSGETLTVTYSLDMRAGASESHNGVTLSHTSGATSTGTVTITGPNAPKNIRLRLNPAAFGVNPWVTGVEVAEFRLTGVSGVAGAGVSGADSAKIFVNESATSRNTSMQVSGGRPPLASRYVEEGSTLTILLDGKAGRKMNSGPRPYDWYNVTIGVQNLTTDFGDLGRASAGHDALGGWLRREGDTDYYNVGVLGTGRSAELVIPIQSDGANEGDERFRVFIAGTSRGPGRASYMGVTGTYNSLRSAPGVDFIIKGQPGGGQRAEPPRAEPPPAPTRAVSNVQVTAVDAASAKVTWDAVERATSYQVEYETASALTDPSNHVQGAAFDLKQTSFTFRHDAAEAMTLTVTVTPAYEDGNGDTQQFDDLAGTATIDVAPAGTGSSDSIGHGDSTDSVEDEGGTETGNTPLADYSELKATVRGYADETQHGDDHVNRWKRALAGLGDADAIAEGYTPMTAAEAQDMADAYSASRWDPVVEALTDLESRHAAEPEPDPPPPPPAPELSLSAGSAVGEGTSASFTIHADAAPDSDVTVSVTVAQSGDWLASPGAGTRSVTLAAGATSAGLAVATVNDSADEPDGSVSVTLDTGAGYTVASSPNDTASVTVRDDDDPPAPPPAIAQGTCVSVAQWNTVKGYYDSNANRSPNYGANWYRVLIAYRQDRGDQTLPAWVGQTAEPTAAYTVKEAEDGEEVWSGWTPVREVLECLEKTYGNSTDSAIGGISPMSQSGEVGTGNPGEARERNRWNPQTAPGGFEPDALPDFATGSCVSPRLRSEAAARAGETWRGAAHVERWLRVAQTFTGGANDATVVTPAEAHFHAAAGQPGWLPVADALRCMEQQSLREALSR